MKNIIISGINGKMGNYVYLSAKEQNLNVVCGVDKIKSEKINCPVYSSFEEITQTADVVIDFSSPSNLSGLLDYCTKTKTPLVVCTTGYSPEDENEISNAASAIPILKTANTSLGVSLFIKNVADTAAKLPDYDIEIVEKHHKTKKDSPSGTAKRIINSLLKIRQNADIVYGRKGENACANGEIGVHSVRGGSVVGEHTVYFFGRHDYISITHSALDKKLFSDGAIEAARFITTKTKGLYSEKDLFGF